MRNKNNKRHTLEDNSTSSRGKCVTITPTHLPQRKTLRNSVGSTQESAELQAQHLRAQTRLPRGPKEWEARLKWPGVSGQDRDGELAAVPRATP